MNKILRNKRLRHKRRGMAMMIVMMLLLLMSSTAIFGVHSTTFEMRAAGLARQAVQTQYIAESGLTIASVLIDQMGPMGAMMALERSQVAQGRIFSRDQPTSKRATGNLHLDAASLQAITDGSLAPANDAIPNGRDAANLDATDQVYGSAMSTDFAIDINDSYTYNVPIRGSRVDGGGNLQYLLTVVTATGSLMPTGTARTSGETSYWSTTLTTGGAGTPSTTTVNTFAREFHRTQAVARGVFVTGPFGR